MIWKDAYTHPSTPFGAKGPFYDPVIGHRGADYDRGAHEPIPAYQPCIIEYVGTTDGLGTVVGARSLTDPGIFYGWAHVRGPATVGQYRATGDPIGFAAGRDDAHGTLWSGPHIHTTRSNQSSYAAACGLLPLYDPAPKIAASISSTAGGGTTTPLEDDDMTPAQSQHLEAIYQALFYGAAWKDRDGKTWTPQYGHFQVDLYTQQLVAGLKGDIAELQKRIEKLTPK